MVLKAFGLDDIFWENFPTLTILSHFSWDKILVYLSQKSQTRSGFSNIIWCVLKILKQFTWNLNFANSHFFVAKMATAKNIFGWFDVLWDFVKGIPEGMKLPESWFSCKQRRRRQRAHFLNVQLMNLLGVVVFINGS